MLEVGTLRERVSVPDVLSPRPPAGTQNENTGISHVGFPFNPFSFLFFSKLSAHARGRVAEKANKASGGSLWHRRPGFN